MPGRRIARMGDTSNHNGSITSGSPNTLVEGMPTARTGDLHSCPIPGHGVTPITGTGGMLVNGLRIVVDGDLAECGAIIQAGSIKSFS